MRVLYLSISLLCFCGLGTADTGGSVLPDEIDPDWLDSWQSEIETQFKMLVAAYELDENMQTLLREELQRRLVEEYAYDQTMEVLIAELNERIQAAQPEPDSPEDEAFARELEEIINRMPLAPGELALWTEGVVPVGVVPEGRSRYEELRFRRDRFASVAQLEDPIRLGSMKREFLDARRACEVLLTTSGKPLPVGPRGETARAVMDADVHVGQVVKPNRVWTTPTVRGPYGDGGFVLDKADPPALPDEFAVMPPVKSPAMSKVNIQNPPTSPASAVIAPPTDGPLAVAPIVPWVTKAPPLDEWDRFVIQASEKYGFSDSHITQARGILRDMRQRASQYRMSRAADFDYAEKLTDAQARRMRVDELNKPLNALFEELKLRVEALPKEAQR